MMISVSRLPQDVHFFNTNELYCNTTTLNFLIKCWYDYCFECRPACFHQNGTIIEFPDSQNLTKKWFSEFQIFTKLKIIPQHESVLESPLTTRATVRSSVASHFFQGLHRHDCWAGRFIGVWPLAHLETIIKLALLVPILLFY